MSASRSSSPQPPTIESGARKIRRSAENHGEAEGGGKTEKRHEGEVHAAEAHNELTDPKHSKGRPLPDDSIPRAGGAGKRPSGGGNDGP
jgi:hypothetical protein